MLTASERNEKRQPKLSVVTPVRNERIRIGRAIDSLKRQSFKDYEHIIVDGSSTDGTLELVEKEATGSEGRIRILKDVTGGVYNAINEGINVSNGEYIALLHGSDAFAADDVMESAVSLLEKTGADLLYGDLHYVNAKGRRVRYYSGKKFRPQLLRDGFMPPHPTVIVRRELLARVGPYSKEYPISADFDWLCRAILKHEAKTVYLELDMVEMSTGGLSGRLSSRLWRHNAEKYRSLRANGFKINPFRLLKRYLYL